MKYFIAFSFQVKKVYRWSFYNYWNSSSSSLANSRDINSKHTPVLFFNSLPGEALVLLETSFFLIQIAPH